MRFPPVGEFRNHNHTSKLIYVLMEEVDAVMEKRDPTMMAIDKPDNIIYYECSGCCCPPGQRKSGGQHTNSGTSWWRLANETQWYPVTGSPYQFRAMATEAATATEFAERYKNR